MSSRVFLLLGSLLILVAASPSPAWAAPPPDRSELELTARTHFAASEYQQALDIYARLYALTLHPTYLRNIGRCYQNLGQPDRAISAFREYLRKAKTLDDRERAEVEQYIREMEAMQAKVKPAAAEPAPAVSPAPAPAAPNLAAPAPAHSDEDDATPTLVAKPKPADEGEPSPFYARWWFWTIVVAAAGGATAAVLLSGDSKTPTPTTTLGTKTAAP